MLPLNGGAGHSTVKGLCKTGQGNLGFSHGYTFLAATAIQSRLKDAVGEVPGQECNTKAMPPFQDVGSPLPRPAKDALRKYGDCHLCTECLKV